jgi:uncharacterized protein DUF5407
MAEANINVDKLLDAIREHTKNVDTLMNEPTGSTGDGKKTLNIEDMFKVQFAMNKLSQVSEMSTNIMSSMNQSIASMARNVKS